MLQNKNKHNVKEHYEKMDKNNSNINGSLKKVI